MKAKFKKITEELDSYLPNVVYFLKKSGNDYFTIIFTTDSGVAVRQDIEGRVPILSGSLNLADKFLIDTVSSGKRLVSLSGLISYFNSASANLSYTGASPSTVEVNGIPAGTDLSTYSIIDLIANIYAPFQQPVFTQFLISSVASIVEVGAEISGNQTFTWVINNAGNLDPDTLSLYDITGGGYVASELSNTSPSVQDVGLVTKTSATSNSWRAEVDDINGDTIESLPYTVNWRWKRYFGFTDSTSDAIDSADILALSGNELTTDFEKSFQTATPGAGGQYFAFAYPASFGDLSSIQVEGFESLAAFTKVVVSHTNTEGVTVNYNVYVSNVKYTVSVIIQTS